MELELTHRNLRRLTEQTDVSLDDVLNFIYDFCQDIKDDTGSPAEKLACRDEDAMYRHLPWMGRMIMKINREQESELSIESRKERLRSITAEIEKIDLELEKAKSVHQDVKKEQDVLREKEEALRQDKQDLLAQQDENRRIEDRIREVDRLDLQELLSEKEKLEKDLAEKTAEKDRLLEEVKEEEEKLRFEKLPEIKEQVRTLRIRIQSLRDLQEKILRDWNSRWGEEQRSLRNDPQLPETVVSDNLSALQGQTDVCEEQLRDLVRLLSTEEVI